MIFRTLRMCIIQIYDMKLKSYRESLEDVHPSLDASVKKKRRTLIGSEQVSNELDTLNKQYLDMVAVVTERVNSLSRILSQAEGVDVSVC